MLRLEASFFLWHIEFQNFSHVFKRPKRESKWHVVSFKNKGSFLVNWLLMMLIWTKYRTMGQRRKTRATFLCVPIQTTAAKEFWRSMIWRRREAIDYLVINTSGNPNIVENYIWQSVLKQCFGQRIRLSCYHFYNSLLSRHSEQLWYAHKVVINITTKTVWKSKF